MSSRYLYLVRHGEATSTEEDPERPLSESGKQATEQMAAWFATTDFSVDEIRHSGKLRAQQTAEIFAQRISFAEHPIEAPGLAPNDNVRPMADSLSRETKSVTLVGHLPFLAKLVGCLVAGDPEQTLVQFDPAGVVILQRGEGQWSIVCDRGSTR